MGKATTFRAALVAGVVAAAMLVGCAQKAQKEAGPEKAAASEPAGPTVPSAGAQTFIVCLGKGQKEQEVPIKAAWLLAEKGSRVTLHFYSFDPPEDQLWPELKEGQYHFEIDLWKEDETPVGPGTYRRGDKVNGMTPSFTCQASGAAKPVSYLFAGEDVGAVQVSTLDLQPGQLSRGGIDLHDAYGMRLKGDFSCVRRPNPEPKGAGQEGQQPGP